MVPSIIQIGNEYYMRAKGKYRVDMLVIVALFEYTIRVQKALDISEQCPTWV